MAEPSQKSSFWKVVGFYGAASWVALQAIDILVDNVGLPTWVFTLALVLFSSGLPVVAGTAYLQGGGRGSVSELAGSDMAGSFRRFLTWRNAILAGVAASLLWGGVAVGWVLFGQGTEGAEASGSPRSIAVLPFTTRALDGDEEALIFSDGMHDDVLTQLSKIDSLKVISRTSVMQYRETDKSIPEIADDLDVATVLEGGLDRAGNRVRLNMQLIDADTDEHLWAETYDKEITAANVFAIRSDLALKIAAALRATLTPETEARIEARPTESLEALELTTRAKYLLNGPRSRSQNGLEDAQDLLERAVTVDPDYAEAWALLARTYVLQWNQAYLSPEEALPMARAVADRALELDPDLAPAHSTRGELFVAELDYEEAEAEMLRALELSPGSSEAHRQYSRLLYRLERHDEAVHEGRRAVELDPLSPTARAVLVSALNFAQDWAGTVEEAEKLIAMEPEFVYAHYASGYAQGMLGKHAEAVASFRRALDLDPSAPYNVTGLAWAWAIAGERDSALSVLEDVPERGGVLKEVAIVHATLGDLDTAYEILERVADEDPGSIGTLTADPTAEPLKSDPRWEQLLQKVGLE